MQVDSSDWAGVARAASDLTGDLERVSGSKVHTKSKILVGTIGQSPTIDKLISEGKLDVREISGKWEASLTQTVRLENGETCLVVVGADKRGTIFALYDLSKAAGVSPWNWWADVPVKHHADVYFSGRTITKSPAVKYRGIFLNDEAPSLSNWATATFGGYNHKFYEKVFELLLRLRANYLWPAMWNNCFSEDDPLNPKLADEYGIVMGTSHVEPMMRADKEWNRLGFSEKDWNYQTHPKDLEKFWTDGINRNKPYENIVTMAMRGKIDTPMSEEANIGLLEKIVSAQRKIIAENVNPDLTKVPQLWCLYKEVQEYYEKGMRVPDDVTLLWADDNWGNIRRLPTPEERKRSGGAGVYYHFDYVGGPRNYKWIDTNPLPKIWEQMNLAYNYGADRIWIVNVGDLKPMEFPLEFFLTFAQDPKAIGKDDLEAYTQHWAAREFGASHSKEIAAVMSETLKLNGMRKPELVSPETYSLRNYHEAERVESRFTSALSKAKSIQASLPAEYRSAFYQLVTHPVESNCVLTRLYLAAAKNHLYAEQGRASANQQADIAKALFEEDQQVTQKYHSINNGKWNHMMDQTHIGYTSWQQPDSNIMPSLVHLDVPDNQSMGISLESGQSELSFDNYGEKIKRIEIFRKGQRSFSFKASADKPWIHLSEVEGVTVEDCNIRVSIDWAKLGSKVADAGSISITGAGQETKIPVKAVLQRGPAKGFLEGDGVVAIEAEHFSRKSKAWQILPNYGRALSAMSVRSLTAQEKPVIEYQFSTFDSREAKVQLECSPSLAFQPGDGLRLEVALDNDQPEIIDIAPRYLSRIWETAVSDSVAKATLTRKLSSGMHTLRITAIDPGVVLERIVVDFGGLKPSFLGPPESLRQK